MTDMLHAMASRLRIRFIYASVVSTHVLWQPSVRFQALSVCWCILLVFLSHHQCLRSPIGYALWAND